MNIYKALNLATNKTSSHIYPKDSIMSPLHPYAPKDCKGREGKSHQPSIKTFSLEKNKAKSPSSPGNTPLLQAKDQKPHTTKNLNWASKPLTAKQIPRTKTPSYQEYTSHNCRPKKKK